MSLTARIFSKGSVGKNKHHYFNDSLFGMGKNRIQKDNDGSYYIYPRHAHNTYGPYKTYKEALVQLRKKSKE